MKLRASNSSGEQFEIPPRGSMPARVVAVIDLGTQKRLKYGSRDEFEDVRQQYIAWELVTKPMSGYKDRNHLVGQSYKASAHVKSKLREVMEAVLGRKIPDKEEVETNDMLGRECLVTIEHSTNADGSRTYANLTNVTPLPEGLPCPKGKHPEISFDFDEDGPDALGDLDLSNLPRVYGVPVEEIIANAAEMRQGQQHKRVASGRHYESIGPGDVGKIEDEIPF